MGYVPLVVHWPARFIAVGAGAFYGHRFWVPSSGALWRCGVGLGSFVLSVLFLAIKASSANSLCVAVVIVRAVRAAVVVIGSCQSVPSIKACCSAVLKTPTESRVT